MTPAGTLLRGLVRGYQLLLSPVLPASCRFHPTCSAYAMEAIAKHGAGKGVWLAARRILRCHPWNEGGYDPVPDPGPRKKGGDTAPGRHSDRMS
ncbi:MAG: membrane protein insertion efficiency factor YidD [Magnetospirillum sp.]|nr:membrane protein insertion efficiency factor YidD [Magnetospirillum sp.]